MKLFLKLALPVASAYLVSFALAYFRKHDLDPHRLFTFGFVRDMQHVAAAEGGFNWLYFTGWFLVCFPTALVLMNFVSVLFYFPPPPAARKVEQTIERLAKLPAHAVIARQASPNMILVAVSPSAPLPLKWFQEHEAELEAGANIDIEQIIAATNGVMKLKFVYGSRRIPAAYFIETSDGSGTLKRVEQYEQPFVYVIGDEQSLEDCSYFRIGFAKDEVNLERRFAVARQQMRDPKRYVTMRVPGISDEKRIQAMFHEENFDLDKFNPSPRLLRWIREKQS